YLYSLSLHDALPILFMFSGLVDGFSNVGSVPFMSVNVLGAFCLGIIGMIGLTWRSLTIATPTLDLRLFKNHRFAGHVLGFFLTQDRKSTRLNSSHVS